MTEYQSCPNCAAETPPEDIKCCPFCQRDKCPTCDMGDDVGCLSCEDDGGCDGLDAKDGGWACNGW